MELISKKAIYLLILLFGYFAGCAGQTANNSPLISQSGMGILPKAEKVKINIEGMTCSICVNAVTKSLKKQYGVGLVSVDLEKGTAIVTARNGEKIDPNKLMKAVSEAGFTPNNVKILEE